MEINYPLRIRRYELIPDSAGPGRYRDGCGIRRDFEFLFSDCTWTVLSDGRKFPPWGLAGGGAGHPARYVYDPDGEGRELRSKSTIDVVKGKTVRVETPGGGGFGDPSGRDRAAVERDVRDGKATEEGARAYDADRLS